MTSFGTLLNDLITETVEISLCNFAPELALSLTIVMLLLLRLFGSVDRWIPPYLTTLIGSVVALGLCGQ